MTDQSQPAASESRKRGAPDRASGLAVWSWVLYDFSNTIFSISILSYFFPLWLGDELGAGADTFNYLVALSALLVVLTAPVLGSVADLRQRRRPYLVVLTVLAVIFTAGLDFTGGVLVVAAALFVAADLCYQSALVFYNALLPVVSAGRGAGRISGYGTAAGYVGTILALVVLTFFVAEQTFFGASFGGPETARSLLGPLGGWISTSEEPNSNAFLPTAVLYLLFSLPAFLFVPDKAIREPRPVRLTMAYKGLFTTARHMRAYAGLGTFMVATVLYTDAANTAVANMSLYGRQVFEMEQAQIQNLLLFSTVFAGVGSVAFGFASDRVGPKKTLVSILVLWLASIALTSLALAPWMLLLAGPLVGAALGGTWTVSRTMLLALSPPDRVGEFFGVYALAGKLSAVAGPAITALILSGLEGYGTVSYRVAIGSLALILGLGLFLLLRVPDARYEETVDEFSPEHAPGALTGGAGTAGSVQGDPRRSFVKTMALRGRVVTDHEVWPEGTVLLEGSCITEVSREPLEADEVHEYSDHLLCPGFVDLQVNGSFGIDVATEPGRVPELSRKLLATGTTAYLPTLISSPPTLYREVLPMLADLAREGVPGGADVLGVHLEGPSINVERKGAHPTEHIVSPDVGFLDELLDLGPVRMLTLAPELEGAAELAKIAGGRGVVVSAGHSNTTFEFAYGVFEGEVASVTHLFNAMSPLHHREPGLPGAAFAHPRVTCGIIADGRHVHPEVVALAFRILGPDRLYLVTDAIAAAGMGPGEYSLATHQVYLDDGVPTLQSGELAGSVLTISEAFRNVLTFTGCTIPEAVRMAAATPARLVGEGQRIGRLAPGYDADVTVLSPDLSVEAVYKGGAQVYPVVV